MNPILYSFLFSIKNPRIAIHTILTGVSDEYGVLGSVVEVKGLRSGSRSYRDWAVVARERGGWAVVEVQGG